MNIRIHNKKNYRIKYRNVVSLSGMLKFTISMLKKVIMTYFNALSSHLPG